MGSIGVPYVGLPNHPSKNRNATAAIRIALKNRSFVIFLNSIQDKLKSNLRLWVPVKTWETLGILVNTAAEETSFSSTMLFFFDPSFLYRKR